jgi:hypothetical protein
MPWCKRVVTCFFVVVVGIDMGLFCNLFQRKWMFMYFFI